MKWINFLVITVLMVSALCACHHEQAYPNVQTQFADDRNFRLGKWYSVTDSGTTSMTHNTNLDTIWFINDTLAGWTGFVPYQPRVYAFFKTYISPQSIYNMVYIAPDPSIPGKMDTDTHQFGFTATGDTLAIYWNFTTDPPQVERYLKMK